MRSIIVSELVIKSQAKNRVRLKSSVFQDTLNNEKILSHFDKEFLSFRVNKKCKSIIFTFDEATTSLGNILKDLNLLFPLSLPHVSSHTSDESHCMSCSSCYSVKNDRATWNRKLTLFGLLSCYSLYIFVAETFLSITIVATPFSLVSIVSIVVALPLFRESLDSIKDGKFTLQTFMSGTLLLAIFFGEATAAFEIIYILRGGMLLEEYIAEKSKKEIRKLIELDVKKVYILVNNAELEVDLDEVEEGDIVVSRSGEKIPVDGFIQAGSAEIDEALINGRSEPAFKKEGAEVFANTFVQKGRISIKVSAVGSDTYISRVISKVELSLQQKSPSELEADRLASKLLKLGSVLTAGTFFITGSYLRAFSVMIVMSCPCATVLAASTAISAGISRAAKDGILIKGGEYLEKVSQSEAFCFDKTGTLTTGKPIVQEVVLSPHVDEKTLFEFASLAEYRNSHPIAVAIMDYAKHIGSLFDEAYSSEIVPGLGVKATKDKEMILVGNKKFLNNNKISVKDFEKRAEKFLDKGETIVYVSYGKEVLGFISFKHEIRDGTIQMLSDLRKRGVEHLVLLTGDEKKVAKNFAREYGFDEVYSNLMPEDKADIVDELKKKYKNIVMIGDGVNDTIAMSRADVAVSFASGGSEAAIEVSNVAITHSHPEDVVNLYDISRKSLKVVNQNYWIGTSTNLGGVALASVGLLSPVAAGAIHLGHTIAIMANSSRVTWSQKEN